MKKVRGGQRGGHPQGGGQQEPWVHPVLKYLFLGILVTLGLRQLEPARDRRAALAEAADRSHQAELLAATPTPEVDADTPIPLVFEALPSAFEPWYLDELTSPGRSPRLCAFGASLKDERRLTIRKQRFENGMDLLLSTQDVAFLAWTAFMYDLNPHFLLGVMMAESGGDCSAVSSAGAQGCFQITYRQGAGQLRNSFKDRVADWYWAKRSNGPEIQRKPGEALGYWPADLYLAPEQYFGMKLKRGTRQLRMTVDPVATLQTSRRAGDTEVSSVANFSFGVIGAGLYYHFLNYYLYSHETQLKGDVQDLTSRPRRKVMWMAASYNQGAPRTMRQLGNYGAEGLFGHLTPDVLNYADTVADYCEQLQLGDKTYGGTMTFGQFSDWLQQLRWTYSAIPIDWEKLQAEVKLRHFTERRGLARGDGALSIDLELGLLDVFRTMVALEPRLGPEKPRLDHKVKF